MIVRSAGIKILEDEYKKDGNRLVLYCADGNSEKELLFQHFIQEKKAFYYRARPASERLQRRMMGNQIVEQYGVALSQYTFEEYFNWIQSGDATKLVIIIDEFQHIVKKDATFLESIDKLIAKRLYPGPVLVILATSAIKWLQEEGRQLLAGPSGNRVDREIALHDLSFLELVHILGDYSIRDCVKAYGVVGATPFYLDRWSEKRDIKSNICNLVLSPRGALFHEAERLVGKELRELSVYNTILASLAAGNRKLNDLYHDTGFSRAKISVYIKNLIAYGFVEKIKVFETGGWENAQKGLYQIRHTFLHFWYRFVYPHLSQLYQWQPEDFYEHFIEQEFDEYLNHYFIKVCNEYLRLMNRHGKLSIQAVKSGVWIGKRGTIDIIQQDSIRRNIVAACNWSRPIFTEEMWMDLRSAMEQARIKAEQYFLFSAHGFHEKLAQIAEQDERIHLVDITEL